MRIEEIASTGEKIYRQKIMHSAYARKKGYFAAIEVRSGKFFVEKTPMAAIERAEIQFPKSKFHLIRIGYKAASSLKRRSSL